MFIPPHDVRHGRNLVSNIYNSPSKAGNQQSLKTLPVIVYGEHGEFYDHASPQQWTPAYGLTEFQRKGARD